MRLSRLWSRRRQARAIFFLGLLFAVFLALSLLIHSPGLLQLDLRITVWLQGFRSPALDFLARSVTLLGNTAPLIALGILAGLFFWRTGLYRAAYLSLLIPPLGLLLNVLIKELIGRPRPEDGLVYVLLTPIGLSFPSGHAMVPAMFYGFLALIAWIHVAKKGWRLFFTSFFIALILAVGLSRVYLGVHWFSDVVGGWTGGLLLLLILARFYRR